MPLWRALDGSGAAPSLVGGKASALDRMVALDLPVPASAVVVATAYRRVAAALPIRLSSTPDEQPEDLARRAGEAFNEVVLDDDVIGAVHAATAHVSSDGAPVAVRSSATAEDTREASFAGQYRTELNVAPGDVEAAVRRCWASLWSAPATQYRSERDIDERDLAMAVVVQAMVPAELSGVAFTIDPVGEHASVVRIESVAGLGESLVSGERTPDVHFVPRDFVDDPTLDIEPWARQLATHALHVEGEFGEPQDIEWAMTDSSLVLLHVR